MAGTPLDAARDVADTMGRVTKALTVATKAALSDAGKIAKAELTKQAGVVPGADRKFSRMAKYNHGGRLAVTTKARNKGAEIWVVPRGPWKLAETGAAPHAIGNGWHPGTTQGQGSWTKGKNETFAQLERLVPDEIGDAVENAFDG